VSLSDLSGTSEHIVWWQECARAVVIFVYGLILVRIAGRRAFGKWSALDIIVSIIVGSNLSRALTGGAPLFATIAATTLLMAFHWILAHAVARSHLLSRMVEGRSIELARSGVERPAALLRHAISGKDLTEALRQAGVESVSDTRRVMLEPSGKITVIKNG
jgi:uncharacterized membrane protein YcaP (DUF421 family)